MFNVELYNRTTGTVIAGKQVNTEPEVAITVREYEARVKDFGEVLNHYGYALSPSGRICGATLQTADGEFHISTARL